METFGTKTEKIRSTSIHDMALEGSTHFLQRSSKSRMSLKSPPLAELKYAFLSRTGRKTKKITALEPLSIDDLTAWASRGIDHFISMQLQKPYAVGKLSIRQAKLCNFSRIRCKTEK